MAKKTIIKTSFGSKITLKTIREGRGANLHIGKKKSPIKGSLITKEDLYLGGPKRLKQKKLTSFRVAVFSRHPSHSPLRTQLRLLPFKGVVRLGSTTPSARKIQCNSIQATRTSADKGLMKAAFADGKVRTAQWTTLQGYLNGYVGNPIEFPIVVKHIHGSRGEGNYLIKSQKELDSWLSGKTTANYIVEKFHDYSREYRLHVTKNGCFYTCRKMLKEETPEDKRWYRNDSNCTWILETNPQFDKPVNWAAIERECVKALLAVGLDVCSCDVKVQSAKDSKGRARKDPEFIIIETNSGSSFGQITLQKYLEEIPKILKSKFVEND